MPSTDVSSVTFFPRGSASPAGVCDDTVVWLRGEHDISTVDDVSESLALAIERDEADVVLDLREATFINAAIIGAIMQAKARLAHQSRALTLRAPAPGVWRILVLCGLTGLVASSPAASGTGTDPTGALRSWVHVPPTERNDASSLLRPRSHPPAHAPIHAEEAPATFTPATTQRGEAGSDELVGIRVHALEALAAPGVLPRP